MSKEKFMSFIIHVIFDNLKKTWITKFCVAWIAANFLKLDALNRVKYWKIKYNWAIFSGRILQAILSSYIHSPNGLLIKVANGENCPIYYLRKIYKCSKLDWCHPAPECEDTGPAPGLRWSHFTSRHRDSWSRDLAAASILHHRFFANPQNWPRSHAPRSGETNHKPPMFHKEIFLGFEAIASFRETFLLYLFIVNFK